MADIIYTIIALFKNSEECRKNKEMAQYRQRYFEMRNLYNTNHEQLYQIKPLIDHAQQIYDNVWSNMDYVPPPVNAERFPIQYKDKIMEATQIQSASMDVGLLANHVSLPNSDGYKLDQNGYPSTVHVPQLPPVEQYYAIGTQVDNKPLLENLQQTYSAMEQQHQTFENNFKKDISNMNSFY